MSTRAISPPSAPFQGRVAGRSLDFFFLMAARFSAETIFRRKMLWAGLDSEGFLKPWPWGFVIGGLKLKKRRHVWQKPYQRRKHSRGREEHSIRAWPTIKSNPS